MILSLEDLVNSYHKMLIEKKENVHYIKIEPLKKFHKLY